MREHGPEAPHRGRMNHERQLGKVRAQKAADELLPPRNADGVGWRDERPEKPSPQPHSVRRFRAGLLEIEVPRGAGAVGDELAGERGLADRPSPEEADDGETGQQSVDLAQVGVTGDHRSKATMRIRRSISTIHGRRGARTRGAACAAWRPACARGAPARPTARSPAVAPGAMLGCGDRRMHERTGRDPLAGMAHAASGGSSR